MNEPQNGVFVAPAGGGVVFDYTNSLKTSVDLEYVEFTAPAVCMLSAKIDGVLVNKTWSGAGSAHSWWSAAGGRFMRYPLKPGQRLTIELDSEGAVRLDWYAQARSDADQ
jgi:hypothetical protein